jgi:phosphatidylserine decarboxylase
MTIAREGYPLIAGAALAAVVTFVVGWTALGIILAIGTLAVAAFFRDPERSIPSGEGIVVAPADGKVVSIVDIKDDSKFAEAATRVSIFLSPLDVHINRMPISGQVEEVSYQRGKFVAAYKDEASARNEQNALKVVDERGRKLGVVQIAGVLARRIICRVRRSDQVQRGERFGLIMFGSRTDAYLPSGCRVEVTEGQRVKGGETILARFV